MSAVVTAAGKRAPVAKPDRRRVLIKEIAARLRSAKSDDEAADALEAALEMARD